MAKIPAITAKRATPSINAAVRIMFARMSFIASGWRAIDSTAPLPIWPIPIPAPMAAKPAPIAPPAFAQATVLNKKVNKLMILLLYWLKNSLVQGCYLYDQSIFMVIHIIVTAFKCLANEHSCKISENVCLDKCYYY